jgi:hypothetical protein
MRRRATELGLALVLLVLFAPAAVSQGTTDGEERADGGSIREAATFLLVPVGARTVGLGGAAAASSADVEGALWSPAALAGLNRSALFVAGGQDFSATARVIGGVLAWRSVRIGATYFHYDLGRIDARDESNGELGTLDPSHSAFIASVAYALGSGIELGASWKLVRLATGCSGTCEGFEATGTGSAFDLAAIARVPGMRGVRAGLLLRNLGGGIGLADGPSDPLPARGRLGIELDLPRALGGDAGWVGGDLAVLARIDVQETLTEFDDLDMHVGLEAGWRGLLFARVGYAASTEGRSGPSLGIGLRWRSLVLDLAHSFDDFSRFEEGTPFQLSLAVRL